jgi:predicted KAP-like P-loop ATPase
VRSLDASEGLVVGVLGAWGSGKTSFVNLAREKFGMAGATILDFNPWMFSGAEQLVESFFVELAAQLRLRPGLTQLGKDLQDYGEMFSGMAWVPLVGPWIERGRGATKILAKILQRRKEGIGGRRTQLERALAALTQPIIVVLDDIDRLSTSEIRDVFKLVRLTASFPNVIYILAFDRHRVGSALAEQGVPGRDYLEKILQLAVDLPAIPPQLLSRQLSAAIDGALADVQNPGPFDEQVWPDIFIEVIRPLIRNMRDTRRYSVAIAGTVIDLEGEVALADVLALEAVRIFLPDVFGCLHSSVEGLTTVSGRLYGAQDPPQLKVQVDRVIESSGTHEVLVRAMIHRLFPAGERHIGGSAFGSDFKGRWLTERRVAHEDILRYYLERIAGEGMHAFTDSEQAWAIIGDRKGLEAYLRSLDRERLQDVIASLESYEERFQPAHVVPGSIVLLNLLPDLPAREQGLFDPDSRLVVARVVLRLLRSLGDSAAVEAAVREILPEVTSLPSKLELINLVGYREGVGHKLVS